MELVGFASIGILVVIQIALFSFGYGKLKQKVDDHCRRLDRIEKLVNNSFRETKS